MCLRGKVSISVLFLLTFLCGCRPNSISENETLPIVIITQDAPESKDYSIKSIAMVHNPGNIVYVDTALNVAHHSLRNLPYDTITIYAGHDNFEIRYDYSAFDRIYYLLNRGDTLLLTYTDKNRPYAKILNRLYNENELNYDYLFANPIYDPDTLSPIGGVSAYSVASGWDDKYISMKEDAEKSLKLQLDNERSYLDSLKENNLVSEEHYVYRKNNIYSILYQYELEAVPENSFFLSDSIFLKYDSLLYLSAYRDLLGKHFDTFFPDHKPIQDERPTYDQVVFNKVIYSPNYSNKVKKYVFQSIKDRLRNFTIYDELQKMLTDYRNITNDSITFFALQEEFGLLRPDGLEISLKGNIDNSFTFKKLLEKYKGQYVFVDFWATWCAPCIELLPDNVKLEKEYHDKNIVFLSLAFQDDEEKWSSYISRNPHKFGTENYFITNSMSSRIAEEWKIKSIPRHMLFDDKGEILLLDAPRPNTKEIRKIFNKLLQ
jgi:thiol-disulfide isomerase/thioredoxin